MHESTPNSFERLLAWHTLERNNILEAGVALFGAGVGRVRIDRARLVDGRSGKHNVAAGLDGVFEAFVLDSEVAIWYVGRAESGASLDEAVR